MSIHGILIGAGAFLIIGILHPVVIKGEYYFGKEIWPVFLVLGLVCTGASLILENLTVSALMAVLGFSLFWSIKELYEQEDRVKKGWFPRNEAREIGKRKKAEEK